MKKQGMLVTRGREIHIPDERELVLGRGKEADVVLRDNRISRAHASIRYRDNGYYLYDLGSFNGTYLNGKRIEGPVLLNPTDEVRIYPFSFVFLLSQTLDKEDGTPNHPFSGNLKTVPLSDLVQMFHVGQRTGKLTVQSNGSTELAELFFEEGEIIHIQWGNRLNEEAFYHLFDLQDGHFKFMPQHIESPGKTIATDTMTLLLNACQRHDEGSNEPVEGAVISGNSQTGELASEERMTRNIESVRIDELASVAVTSPRSEELQPGNKRIIIKKPRAVRIPPKL